MAVMLVFIACWSVGAQTLSLDRAGLLSWANGSATSGYYRIDYFAGAPCTAEHAWGFLSVSNNAQLTQALDLPWAYRLVWTADVLDSDGTNAVPADWFQMPVAQTGRSISWLNLDDVTTYAMGWKLTPTDSVWRLNWSDYINLPASATGSVRVPIHFALFLRRPYIDQPAAMARILPAGFIMGDTVGDGDEDERPIRDVTTSLYMIDVTETTEAAWEAVRTQAVALGYTDLPSGALSGGDYPVRGISWLDAVKWCNARSELAYEIPEYRVPDGSVYRTGTATASRIAVNGYRLPTEAEWEKAARGSSGNYACGGNVATIWPQSYSTDLSAFVYVTNPLAVYRDMPRTNVVPVQPVGSIGRAAWSYRLSTSGLPDSIVSAPGYSDANLFGLRDMGGNVFELCDDWYGVYDPTARADPCGPTSGLRRVLRGGGWCSKAEDLRVSARNSIRPSARNRGVGFRSVKRPWSNEDGRNLLVVFNTNVSASATLARYYVSARPGIASATMLGVGATTGEVTSWADFTNQIFNPVTAILATNPEIRYVVMMYGLPTRSATSYEPGFSLVEDFAKSVDLSYRGARTRFLPTGYPRSRALVTYLTGRTPDDVSNYIARLAVRFDGHCRISGGQSNGWYVLDDSGSSEFAERPGLSASGAVRSVSSSARIVYRDATSDHVTAWSNVAGYLTWGWQGGLGGDYATNGTVRFYGTNWYVMQTIESYNGQLGSFQGNVYDWMSRTAFGSTNYENCPIGAVCHVDEPGLGGINNELYFQLWEAGLSFAECAWASSGPGEMMAVGDPLVTR